MTESALTLVDRFCGQHYAIVLEIRGRLWLGRTVASLCPEVVHYSDVPQNPTLRSNSTPRIDKVKQSDVLLHMNGAGATLPTYEHRLRGSNLGGFPNAMS